MCGIVGGVALANAAAPLDLETALTRMVHRGPDADGRWHDDRCTLGFRRLAIIDLSDAGCQPMANGDGTLELVFNGEIYNFQALRRELEEAGYRFRSRSDSEVVLHAYHRWGTGCLRRFRGMFAFAVWDARKQQLFLARDRVGKKPLFHAVAGGRFLFASELQSLLALPDVRANVDPAAIDQYLSWGYVPAPLTGFAGISKLPPGHYAIVDVSGGTPNVLVERWWTLTYSPKHRLSTGEACEAIRQRLTEAVRLRMISDVPLGAFLSGGIDSSIVVGLMASLSSQPVKTYSIGFEERAFDELPHARRIAERWGTEHHEVVVRPDASDILPLLVRHYGEPYADSSAIPTYYVSQIARTGVTVALNGDGGDESFAGYERYVGTLLAAQLQRMPGREALLRAASRLLPSNADPKSKLRAASRFLAVADQPLPIRYRRWQGYFDDAAKRAIAGEALRPHLTSGPHDWFDRLFDEAAGLHPVDAAMSVDVRSYLPFDLLVKVDITSMANSLEARSPFLDHEVMELAARLPVGQKLRHGQKKHLLRRAFHDLLPKENVRRRKMGFGVPVGEWFRGPMRELVEDALLGGESAARGLVDPATAGRLLNDHIERRGDHTSLLWNLLMLELWHREVVDGRFSERR